MEDQMPLTEKTDEQEYLDNIHRTLKEILDYVVGVCDAQGFTYFLVYGTALGAKRHKGFIPWDDDIDIGLPRKDYDAFIRYMEKQENGAYSLQYTHNEKRYFLYFPKVRKADTLFRESIVDGVYKDNGIFIDIFPLEYVDEKNVAKIPGKYKKLTLLKHFPRFIECRPFFKENSSRIRYLADCILSIPFRLVNRKKYISWLNRYMSKDGSEETAAYIADYDTVLGLVKKDVYFPPAQLEFEGTMYNVPHKIDEYLTDQYGDDFMELPPVEQRVTHTPSEVRF